MLYFVINSVLNLHIFLDLATDNTDFTLGAPEQTLIYLKRTNKIAVK